jgi:hypothetical protein
MKIAARRHWRWWAVAAAAALVIERLRRQRWASKGAVVRAVRTSPPEDLAHDALTENELGEIFVLGRHFVETRGAETDTERDACLGRAAEIVLKDRLRAAAFVGAMHREAFARVCKSPMRREHSCERCGAPMRETSVFDADVGESLPAWICGRCGAQTPR